MRLVRKEESIIERINRSSDSDIEKLADEYLGCENSRIQERKVFNFSISSVFRVSIELESSIGTYLINSTIPIYYILSKEFEMIQNHSTFTLRID